MRSNIASGRSADSRALIIYAWSRSQCLGNYFIVIAWMIGWPIVAVGGAPRGSTEFWVGLASSVIACTALSAFFIAVRGVWRVTMSGCGAFVFNLWPWGWLRVTPRDVESLVPRLFTRSLARGASIILRSGRQIWIDSEKADYGYLCRIIGEAIERGVVTPESLMKTPAEIAESQRWREKQAATTRNGLIILGVTVALMIVFVLTQF